MTVSTRSRAFLRRLFALLRWDITQALRDPVYSASLLGIVAIALVGRFGVPVAVELLEPYFTLSPYTDFIYALILLFPALLIGMLMGFVLLDERDEGLLSFYEVTPLRYHGYIVYRLGAPMTIGAIATFGLSYLFPLAEMPLTARLLLALGAAAQSPAIVLFLGGFARNKVEGLAYSKASGLVIAAPIAAHFLPGGWGVALGIVPTVLITEGITMRHAVFAHLYPVAALALFAFGIVLLYKRFERIPHQSE